MAHVHKIKILFDGNAASEVFLEVFFQKLCVKGILKNASIYKCIFLLGAGSNLILKFSKLSFETL